MPSKTNKLEDHRQELRFFSIIIPAHNEEQYIRKTISSIKEIDYPQNKIEVIIIENGSADRTNEVVRQTSPDWFQVINLLEPGVSKAKNKGIEKISGQSDWVIFLDADTYFEKGFLKELNQFLNDQSHENLGCGMVSLLPYPDSLTARLWYRFYNFADHLVKATRSIQIIRRDLLREFRFDEALSFDEDTTLIRQCETKTKYFFLKTNRVFSSTRRFDQNGWLRQLIEWISFASSSYEEKIHIKYKVTR